MADEQEPQGSASGKELRAFLSGFKAARPEIAKVLVNIRLGLFAGLEQDKLLIMDFGNSGSAKAPTMLRVDGARRSVVLKGTARLQDGAVVPCIEFRVGDRAVHVKLLFPPRSGAWVWSESAGIGVDGQPLTTETTSKVFLKLLAGEV